MSNNILDENLNQVSKSKLPPMTPEQAMVEVAVDIVKESMRCFTDYMKCREQEITERKRISACLSVIVKKIDSQKEMYIKTIETNYTERKELYSKADAALQKALENQDMEMLKCTYNYILTIYNGAENRTLQLANEFVSGSNNIIEFL